ncbi:hypothetical protein TNCV_4652381 [Trichonephila clavipes]|nr:hypothetical protein TNCV_4652381 [Trichonephila clavipes]
MKDRNLKSHGINFEEKPVETQLEEKGVKKLSRYDQRRRVWRYPGQRWDIHLNVGHHTAPTTHAIQFYLIASSPLLSSMSPLENEELIEILELSSSEYHIFDPLQKALKGREFPDDNEIQAAVEN